MKLLDVFQSKELNELLVLIKKNSEAISEQNMEIERLQEQISELGKDFQTIGADNQKLNESVKHAVSAVHSLNSELEESTTDLKVLKAHLQTKIADKIEEEFKFLLSRFEKDVDSIGKLNSEIQTIHSEITRLRAEIERLSKVSSSIKSMDFELTSYAKKLQLDDAEKLRLMRQIDSLERLVSKLRRVNR